MRNPGALLCLASGAAFGAMAIFGKLAYQEGATVGTLLAVRFALAALLFWALVAAQRRPAPRCARSPAATSRWRSPSARSATAPRPAPTSRRCGGWTPRCSRCCSTPSRPSSPLPRSRSGASASVPARRRRWPWRRSASCSCWRCRAPGRWTRSGTALGDQRGGHLQHLSPGLGGRGEPGRPAHAQRARVHRRDRDADRRRAWRTATSTWPPSAPPATAGLPAIAVISTVAAVGLLFAGIRRVGPTSASILSTTEPVVTVVLAFLVFGESLGAVQLLGGALVLGAAVVLTASARRSPQQQHRDVERQRAGRVVGHASSTTPRGRDADGGRPDRRSRCRRRARRGGHPPARAPIERHRVDVPIRRDSLYRVVDKPDPAAIAQLKRVQMREVPAPERPIDRIREPLEGQRRGNRKDPARWRLELPTKTTNQLNLDLQPRPRHRGRSLRRFRDSFKPRRRNRVDFGPARSTSG